jgi:hypothetical protein
MRNFHSKPEFLQPDRGLLHILAIRSSLGLGHLAPGVGTLRRQCEPLAVYETPTAPQLGV